MSIFRPISTIWKRKKYLCCRRTCPAAPGFAPALCAPRAPWDSLNPTNSQSTQKSNHFSNFFIIYHKKKVSYLRGGRLCLRGLWLVAELSCMKVQLKY